MARFKNMPLSFSLSVTNVFDEDSINNVFTKPVRVVDHEQQVHPVARSHRFGQV